MKKAVAVILAVCLAETLCFGLVGCTDGTGNETEQTTCTFEETTHYANGDTEVNEYVARYVGARLTIEKAYEEGTYYSYRYDIDSSTGDIVGASSGSLGSCGPEPGTYYMEAPINDTGSFRFTLEIIINEPDEFVDSRITPDYGFDPNGAIDYVDNVNYVYAYDGGIHHPTIYGVYDGQRLPVNVNAAGDGIVSCVCHDGSQQYLPCAVGKYTLTYRIEDGQWMAEEHNARFYGITAQITVEIVESTGAAQQ